MSRPLQTAPNGPSDVAPDAQATPDLPALRAELDRLDDAMHDLLMHRAEVVTQVAGLGVKGRVPLRPGREASIIRRLVARHGGVLPGTGIVRIWRELLSATTTLQHPLLISVCEPDGDPAYAAAAREQFGALAPLRLHRTPAQAIRDVSAGMATAAILPLPSENETAALSWWIALLHKEKPRIHIVARLPFWTPRPEGAPLVQAFVVSAASPDPSGQDRSLLGLELSQDTSRARLSLALATAGFVAGATLLRRDPGAHAVQGLIDVDGFVSDGDPRLAELQLVLRPPVVLGAYAVPLDPAPLDQRPVNGSAP